MPNSITNILDKILAQGLVTLRESAVMPRLVNTDYQGAGAQQGNTIDIPVPKTQAVSTVSASNSLKAAADKTPGLVQVSLDQWKMTDFHLTDKEISEIDRNRHFIPMQTEEAARAIANNIDNKIHADYTGVYGFVGTGGTTPFSTVATATGARKVLNEQLAPMNDRRIVMDPAAEDQALQLSAYSDISQGGDRPVKIDGEIGRKFGMDHFMSQNVNTHTTGTVVSAQVASTTAAGSSTLGINGLTAGGTIVVGDVFTIAGQSTTYVAKTAHTLVSTVAQNVTIDPALSAIASATSVVQVKATHVVNLAFQRGAFAYVTRPVANAMSGMAGGNPQSVLTDNQTGLTMRLEIVRQHKQNAFQFDVLYGTKLVRPQFAMRIGG
tara:strand:+ start:606 stop:1745 length:1140 start_codon:yes stop_codon:yes gene_type:complete